MVNVSGKWALVTGASRGIGSLASAFLADRGCNIIALCRDTAVDDKKSGRLFPAGEFYGMSLQEAVAKAETM